MGDGVYEDVREICGLGGHPIGSFGGIEHGVEDTRMAPSDVRWKIEEGKGGGENVT